MSKYFQTILFLSVLMVVSSCVESKYGSAKKNEKVTMAAPPKRNVISYALLKNSRNSPLV